MATGTQRQGAPLRLDVANEWVWQGEQRLQLTPKAFAVLRYLLDHPSRVVTKDELLREGWPDTVVSEWVLTSCIRQIRRALGEEAGAPQYIDTVHRRGYRFIGAVRSAESGVRSQNSHPAPSTQHPAPSIVGRGVEITHLHRWLEKALSGERQLVFVTGEPGIGKTTVVEAFLQSLAARGQPESGVWSPESGVGAGDSALRDSGLSDSLREADPRRQPLDASLWIGHGQCIEHYGAGEAYLPVLEALGRLCREPGGEHLLELLGQQAPTWLVQLPALLSPAELEALQRKVLGATGERMLREMAEAVEAITAERPLVLWLEDLHWSDYSTLDWLAFVARQREPARLLVIGTYRPVEVIAREHPLKGVKQELQSHGHGEELPLTPLSETAVEEYLAVRFTGGAPVPLQRLARMVHQRTEGNPLFMVNVVDDLVRQGLLRQSEGGWELKVGIEEVAARVPESVQQMIEKQLERLSPEDQRVLEVASVAGIEFSAAAVAASVEAAVAEGDERCA